MEYNMEYRYKKLSDKIPLINHTDRYNIHSIYL